MHAWPESTNPSHHATQDQDHTGAASGGDPRAKSHRSGQPSLSAFGFGNNHGFLNGHVRSASESQHVHDAEAFELQGLISDEEEEREARTAGSGGMGPKKADDEENLMAARNQREDDVEEVEDEGFHGSQRGSPEASDSSEDEDDQEERKARRSAAKDRENRIKADRKTNDVSRFAFDDTKGGSCTFTLEYDSSTAKILMLHLVENAARASLIQSVPGISAAMLDEAATKEAGGTPILVASGVNLPAMWDYQHIINPHHLYTNSINDTLTYYGVEAARASIVLELQAVFGGHGISVDPRHLNLIADFMTRDGGYVAFNRMGYRGNTSPFMKMSFETTVGFLRDAVCAGDVDDVTNPSSRIVTGRLGKIGTGGFDVFLPVGGEERDGDGDGDVEMEG